MTDYTGLSATDRNGYLGRNDDDIHSETVKNLFETPSNISCLNAP